MLQVDAKMLQEDLIERNLAQHLETINGFKDVKVIGKGGYGTVFHCFKGEQQLAIKVIR